MYHPLSLIKQSLYCKINLFLVINVTLMEQVNPNSGPYQGGTDITITGTDLGIVFEDIITITMGGSSCRVYNDSYQPGVG